MTMGGKDMEIKTTDDLRKAYPDLVAASRTRPPLPSAPAFRRSRTQLCPARKIRPTRRSYEAVDSASFAKAVIASMKAKQQEQSKNYLNSAKEAAENSNATASTTRRLQTLKPKMRKARHL